MKHSRSFHVQLINIVCNSPSRQRSTVTFEVSTRCACGDNERHSLARNGCRVHYMEPRTFIMLGGNDLCLGDMVTQDQPVAFNTAGFSLYNCSMDSLMG